MNPTPHLFTGDYYHVKAREVHKGLVTYDVLFKSGIFITSGYDRDEANKIAEGSERKAKEMWELFE